ncbi:MAG TPA: hypothetical protein VN442_14470 [Bryobacteraceae bacterium]|nr:hypothetical protein [Bryobacteraceae bacterium]
MIELLVFAALAAAHPSADEIMARVAENQRRAVEMRSAFVYRQNVLVRLHRGNGRLAREEMSNFTVTPTADGFKRQLDHFAGKYQKDGRYIEYAKPGYEYNEMDIDGQLASDFADDFTGDGRSRDGVGAEWFPLTPERQQHYRFRLEGREEYLGRDVWRITLQPRGEQGFWAGEVLVDAAEFQPVLVTTHMAKGIPMVVRTVLGTNLKQFGFKVAYEKFAEGVWFPARYGGEFELRLLFLYKRKISISAVNSGFQRAEVDSRVLWNLPQ